MLQSCKLAVFNLDVKGGKNNGRTGVTWTYVHRGSQWSHWWIFEELSDIVLKKALSHSHRPLCEAGFSTLTYKKSKYRTRLIVEDSLRLFLISTQPELYRLVSSIKALPSQRVIISKHSAKSMSDYRLCLKIMNKQHTETFIFISILGTMVGIAKLPLLAK